MFDTVRKSILLYYYTAYVKTVRESKNNLSPHLSHKKRCPAEKKLRSEPAAGSPSTACIEGIY